MGQLLDFYTTDKRFKDKINIDVIKFIDEVSNFPDRDNIENDSIDHLFCSGYCYYFANMLKLAFGGKVCWAQDRGHIVWADCDENCSFEELQKACVYDITGVYDDYDKIWPVEYLGDIIIDYMHNNKEFHLNQDFKDWCDFCKVTECFAIDVIWGIIPIDEIMQDYKNGLNYVETAYQYWIKYTRELQQILKYIKKKKKRIKIHQYFLCDVYHKGIENYLNKIEE